VAIGVVFHKAIDRGLEVLTSIGSRSFTFVAGALLIFIAFKYWQRRRFYRALRLARITPEDLHRLMDEGRDPVVLDVRTSSARRVDPRRIPGARVMEYSDIEEKMRDLPHDREIILYCT
jgi:hypothetical protein